MDSHALAVWAVQAVWLLITTGAGFLVKRLIAEIDDLRKQDAELNQMVNSMKVEIATLKTTGDSNSERMTGLKDDLKDFKTELMTRIDKVAEKLDKLFDKQNGSN